MNNLLPKDGTVYYYGKIFTEEQSEIYYVKLLNEINWQHDVVKIFGKEIITKRKVAFLGDEGIFYKYSGKTKIAEKWLKFILEIKSKVEQISGEKFNACLLNYYHNGSEAMSWHSDNEKEILKHSAIASVSFGAERKFGFKHNFSKEEIFLMLENGSLLIMKDETQIYWKHKLYTNAKIIEPRINLTFRTIINN
ncbi:alpha-ketoglutarate-dependent dioxygenase AlkB family protein [Cloacibacterium normanense]|uniref:2OG-Fe(II) oxygenase superfamily protein n=1 Tax=Cloacibacterium normanense TaxID=237258 RepID=A0A1E5UEC1_9FLAO|nr:alpha-ketoglutarate-dependent dioxygenase AlkB [Cloacibacterium normanense]AZI69296.1 alpha-ketoglutarate-dependent dioxygenase AlkB [Cloacibacterium normanense]OEL11015.1 2OG-Fe(II) oxygenase superfamily protein [Cloacibacterium normanense]SDO65962.1 Alkylated DNA repair dioxygenase AlkB [Cloacibacterium normanense]